MSLSFSLPEEFISKFEGTQPNWGYGDLSYFVYKRTYAREKDNGEIEEFYETIRRVVEGTFSIQKDHCIKNGLPWSNSKALRSAKEMYNRLWDFKFAPPGRGYYCMGTKAVEEKGGACLNNCGFVSTKDIDKDFSGPFIWSMDMSMVGVGVGFDVRGEKHKIRTVPCKDITLDGEYFVPDTKEGWGDAVRIILDFVSGVRETLPLFNLSLIREKGAKLKTMGGEAPGPEPLAMCLDALIQYFNESMIVDARVITDVMNIIGRCVVSGGIRRSSQIAIGDGFDVDFINLKNREVNSDRIDKWGWASNNSCLFDPDADNDYSYISELIAKNGEPGAFWLKNAQRYGRMLDLASYVDFRAIGCNPCGEQTLEDRELCCLVETYPEAHSCVEDYRRTLKFAYMYAKTVTLVKTSSEETNAVMLRNRRIGTSQAGVIDAIEKFGYRRYMSEFCDESYKYICELDKVYSGWLCVPLSIKKTSIKPGGTVPLLAGQLPGIHRSESLYQIKRIRVAETSRYWKMFEDAGYNVVDDIVPFTKVIEFPLMPAKRSTKTKSEATMWEQFNLAADMQKYWSDNQVSVTITFKPEEAKDIPTALSMFQDKMKSVSLLPLVEHGYKLAPNEAISKEQYDEMCSKIKYKVDLSTKGLTNEVQDKFCDSDFCTI